MTGICAVCGCTTGGGAHCYRHVPYTVEPLRDGSYRVCRNGGIVHCWVEPRGDEEVCVWTEDDDPYMSSVWDTSCDQKFVFIDGTPVENKMAFCCYCGKPLQQRIPEEDTNERREDG